MEQLEFFTIPSPCINVCQADAKGYCLGCFRTRDERFYWQQLSDAQKRSVLRACRIRKAHKERKASESVEDDAMKTKQASLFE